MELFSGVGAVCAGFRLSVALTSSVRTCGLSMSHVARAEEQDPTKREGLNFLFNLECPYCLCLT